MTDHPTQAQLLAAKGYYTVERVAELLGVRRQAVYALIKSGRLPALPVVQRFYVKQSDLIAHVGPEAAAVLGIAAPAKRKSA